jgi:hypothetical protein
MMKCKTCGRSIIIYCASDGSVHILDKPTRGFTDAHMCGSGNYSNMLSKSMMKKLGVEDAFDE